MTPASGILHEEFHSRDYAARGGAFHMAQLWGQSARQRQGGHTRLPVALTNAQIPDVALPDDAGRVRVIAGEFAGQQGPAHTFTAMNVWDVRMNAGKSAALCRCPETHTGRGGAQGHGAHQRAGSGSLGLRSCSSAGTVRT